MNKNTLTTINLVFLFILLIVFAILSIYLSYTNLSYRNQDFFTFWLGGRMAAQGENVYDQTLWVANHALYGSTWVENLFYVYPLFTAYFAIPLGLLKIELASVIWLFLTFVSITAGIMLLLSLWRKVAWAAFVIPILFGTFLFRPTFLNLITGQIDGFLFLFFGLSLFLFAHKKELWACAVLSLLILKPNLGVPVIAMYIVFTLFQKHWKQLLVITSMPLAITLILLLFDSAWLRNYFFVGLHKSADNNLFPNLRGLAGLLSGGSLQWTIILWLILVIITIAVMVFVSIRQRSKMASSNFISLSLIVTLLITPYLRAYDLILLLIPIMLMTDRFSYRWPSFLKINLAYLFWSFLAFAFLFLAVRLSHDILSVFLSLTVLVLFIRQISLPKPSLTIPLS
ncbi:MAG: glycosyltransferase family 87 protein [Anaerolineaceae bacterium]